MDAEMYERRPKGNAPFERYRCGLAPVKKPDDPARGNLVVIGNGNQRLGVDLSFDLCGFYGEHFSGRQRRIPPQARERQVAAAPPKEFAEQRRGAKRCAEKREILARKVGMRMKGNGRRVSVPRTAGFPAEMDLGRHTWPLSESCSEAGYKPVCRR